MFFVVTLLLIGYGTEQLLLLSGDEPVITCEAPPPNAKQSGAFRLFHSHPEPTYDTGGLPRATPAPRSRSTPRSSSGSRSKAVVLMESPTRSNKSLYKSSDFGACRFQTI